MKNRMIICLSFVYAAAFSQQSDKLVREGNEYYKKKQFDKAALAYGHSIELNPSNNKAKFNLGNAMYRQNKPEEAINVFNEIAGNKGQGNLLARAFYNIGVALGRQKKWEESIEAYKNALRKDPDDKEARENLQKTLLELKKKRSSKEKPDDSQKKKQEQQQLKMSLQEAEQRLKLLAQKEKEVQQKVQMEKNKPGNSQRKDW